MTASRAWGKIAEGGIAAKKLAAPFLLMVTLLTVPAAHAGGPLLRISPHAIALGSIDSGVSVQTTVTVTNRTNRRLSLNTFEVFGANGNWALQLPGSCGAGTTLAARGSCFFRITTTPFERGRIRGTFCVTGVVGTAFSRQCGRIVGHAT